VQAVEWRDSPLLFGRHRGSLTVIMRFIARCAYWFLDERPDREGSGGAAAWTGAAYWRTCSKQVPHL